jgi:hypothetical protein
MSNRRRRDAKRRKVSKQLYGNLNVRCFTRSKLGEETNADAFDFDLEKGRFAIADGVSRSFRPHLWSNHICRSLVKDRKELTRHTCRVIAQSFGRDEQPLPWNLAELRDRGSHATVLVLDLMRRRSRMIAEVSSIGDCIFAITSQDGRKISRTWPFNDVGDMPFATSAISSVNPFLMGSKIMSVRLELKPGTRTLIMTDAMARHLISSHSSLDHIFPFLFGAIQFDDWADSMRQDGLIENDDLTMLEISFDVRPSRSRVDLTHG